MTRMRDARKTSQRPRGQKKKKSFTLSPESIALLDDLCAQRKGGSRKSASAVLDGLLRTLLKERQRQTVERAVTQYYDNLSREGHAEEVQWGEFALQEFPDKEA